MNNTVYRNKNYKRFNMFNSNLRMYMGRNISSSEQKIGAMYMAYNVLILV